MANTKEIQKRMKSIKDTMKITNAMYMISSTKLQKAKTEISCHRALFLLYYSSHFSRILRHTPDLDSIYFKDTGPIWQKKTKKMGYIVVTADKGTGRCLQSQCDQDGTCPVSKKAVQNRLFVLGELRPAVFCQRGAYMCIRTFSTPCRSPSLHRARLITDTMIDLYQKGELR